MANPSRLDLELNELKWWSNWVRIGMLGRNAYMMTSRDFQEAFFNRACFVDCNAVSTYREEAEKRFRRLGLPSVLTVNEGCASARSKLVRSGYRTSETMTVMVSARRLEPAEGGARIKRVSSESAKEWSRAYLLSFYGDETPMPAVTEVVGRLVRNRAATLLEAELDGSVAGVLAVFRTRRVAGVYCVGTVPKFRRQGVAGALMARAGEIASSEGRRLILQTLKSDGAEAFYSKRGFVPAYQKAFMRQEN